MIKWFEKYYIISYIMTMIIAIAIFYISSMTFEGGGTGPSINSHIYHFTIFFLLTFFLLISMIKGKNNKKYVPLIMIAISIALIYGISDEIHQLFVPFRHGSVEDVLTNFLGILSAGIIYTIRLKIKKNK